MKLVLGLGKTGLSIARFLTKQNIQYRLSDSRLTPPLLADYLAKYSDENLILGDWTQDVLLDIDEVFISPGIAKTEAIVLWAYAKKIPIISDIELFGRYAKVPIIGITGSNGKSTVTQLLGKMITKGGNKVAIGGNIGTPALDCLSDEVEYYVLELSSYQLDYTQHLALLTGVVLNITPDHLDRYENFEQYKQSKLSLYDYCQKPIFNLDECHTQNTPEQPLFPKGNSPSGDGFGINMPKKFTHFSMVTCHDKCYFIQGDDVLMDAAEAQLIGRHNQLNILAAFALGKKIGLSTDAMVQGVKQFKGLTHRLEWVCQKQGVDYYNDSKATNAIATISAINALSSQYKNICLIMGGIQKDEDYTELFSLIDQHINSVILIGQSAKSIAEGIHQATIAYADSMQTAVKTAQNINPDVILLSPACASFDMFDDFEQRGKLFKQCVLGY